LEQWGILVVVVLEVGEKFALPLWHACIPHPRHVHIPHGSSGIHILAVLHDRDFAAKAVVRGRNIHPCSVLLCIGYRHVGEHPFLVFVHPFFQPVRVGILRNVFERFLSLRLQL
jgi:hypothetical protein